MAITPLPTPPSRQDPVNFADRADEFLGALPDFATEANALAVDVNADAVAADASADASASSAADSGAQAVIATDAAEAALASQLAASNSASAASASEIAAAGYANSAAQITTAFDTLRPKVRPALNLDFVNQEIVDRRIVVSRNGPKSYFGKRKVLGDENLVRFSEQFDNASWSKSAVTVTANTTVARDSLTIADSLIETAATGQHFASQAVTGFVTGQKYRFSIFAKKGVGATAPDWIQLAFATVTSQYANFNLTTGTVGTSTSDSASITAQANGFYRISIEVTITSTATGSLVVAFVNNNDALGRLPSYSGATTSDVAIWGAQLEQRSTLTGYVRTVDYPVRTFFNALETAAANVMPVEYDPVSQQCLGIKPESAATNRVLQSENFTVSPWAASVAGTSTRVNAGSNLGFMRGVITATSANGGIRQSFSGLASGQIYTISFYIQSNESSIRFVFENGSFAYGSSVEALINPSNGTFVTVSGITSARVKPYGLGYIYEFVLVPAGGSLIANFELRITNNGGVMQFGMPQFEAGSFSTSYIPTASAQVTRLADNLTVPVSAFDYNQNEGALYTEIDGLPSVDTNTALHFVSLIKDTSNLIRLRRDDTTGSLRLDGLMTTEGIAQVAIVSANNFLLSGTKYRMAVYFSDSAAALYSQGAIVGAPDTVLNIPKSITTLEIGAFNSANHANCYIRCLRYYNVALSASEAQSLSKV